MWGLVTVVIILGGILSGVFTPTESAAVACLYAFAVTMFIYRDYRWRELPMLLHRVTKMVAMVMMLIGFSAAFGYMMALMQVPAKATQFFVAIASNKYELLVMINVVLIVLGTFMDMAPMILICTPILLPVILKFGIDPVHFGMILLVNSGIYGAICLALLLVSTVPALSLGLTHLPAQHGHPGQTASPTPPLETTVV